MNNFLQFFSALKGRNLNGLVNSLINSNPAAKQAWQQTQQLIQGKSSAEIEQLVGNMCQQRGTSIDEVKATLGIK